jgi:hypothetical protein
MGAGKRDAYLWLRQLVNLAILHVVARMMLFTDLGSILPSDLDIMGHCFVFAIICSSSAGYQFAGNHKGGHRNASLT